MSAVLRQALLTIFAAAATALLAYGSAVADENYANNAARLKEMSAEQKEELSRKRSRFEELGDGEKQRLRDLHGSITSDPGAEQLLETLTRYNRWLAMLDPAERSTLRDIKDPEQQISRIKELMRQQEERRFKEYFAKLPAEDRETIHQWIGEFVAKREKEIRDRLPPPFRDRLDAASADDRRRELFNTWYWRRRQFDLPIPDQDDCAELFKRFTVETQKAIESSAAGDIAKIPEAERSERLQALQRQRVEELWRVALYSRFFSQPREEELLKFYHEMKSDDPRRKQLEGKEGVELRRELQRMYASEHGSGRGGPPGPPGSGRGFGPPNWPGGRGDGRGPPPPDGRGPKFPPDERRPPPP